MPASTVLRNILLFIIILSYGDNCRCQHDGDNFYLNIKVPNSSVILKKIASIPLRFYEFKYDSIAGRLQMGFFGAEVMTAFPDSVEIAPKYLMPNRDRSIKPTVLVDYPLVDKSVVFMHSIAAIQELQRSLNELSVLVDSLTMKEQEMASTTDIMAKLTKDTKTWLLSTNVKILTETTLPKIERVDVNMEKTHQLNRRRKENAVYKKNMRDEIQLTHHHRMSNATENSIIKLEDIAAFKLNFLNNQSLLTFNLENDNAIDQIDAEFNESVEMFNIRISQISALMQYRIITEQETIDEEHDLALIKARDTVMRGEYKYVIDTFFSEVSLFLSGMNIDPSLLFIRGIIGLSICLLILIVCESGEAVKQYFLKRMLSTPGISMRNQSLKGTVSMKDLIHDTHTKDLLDAFSATLRNSSLRKLPLPNLLLCGKSGTGM